MLDTNQMIIYMNDIPLTGQPMPTGTYCLPGLKEYIKWNANQNAYIFITEKVFKNVICDE